MLRAAVVVGLAILASGGAPQDREMSYWRPGAPRYLRVWSGEDGKPASLIVEAVGATYAPPHKADIDAAPWDLLDLARWAEPKLLTDARSPRDYRVVLEDGQGGREVGQRSGTWTSIHTFGDEGSDQEEITSSASNLRINIRADQLTLYRAGPQVSAFMTVHPAKGPGQVDDATILGEHCVWGRREVTPDSGVLMCTTADGIVLARQGLSAYGGEPMLKAVELKRGPRPLAEVLPATERLQAFAWRQP